MGMGAAWMPKQSTGHVRKDTRLFLCQHVRVLEKPGKRGYTLIVMNLHSNSHEPTL